MKQEQKSSEKFFFFTSSLSTELLEYKQRFKLGGVDTPVSHVFPLVLDSNLHDLSETNPGLTLFSAEQSWCCFCAEIKVLGMERNFARIFYVNEENFWSQEPPEGGT